MLRRELLYGGSGGGYAAGIFSQVSGAALEVMEAARMPRYYFNVHDEQVTLDLEGIDCPNADFAIELAIRAAREMAAETAHQGCLVAEHRIEIVDSERRHLDTITFGEAVGFQG